MTAVTMRTGMITIQLPRHRVPVLRRLALGAALVLLTWSGGRTVSTDHEAQSRRRQTERDIARARDGFRYGFLQ